MLLKQLLRITLADESSSTAASRAAIGEHPVGVWDDCEQSLFMHRLAAPVWSALLRRGLQSSVPPRIARVLHAQHVETALINTEGMAQLAILLDTLRGKGVEPIIMKGAALLNTVYLDPGARPACDIDILVNSGERVAAWEALESIGYEIRTRSPDAVVFRNESGITFDVHHRFRILEEHERETLLATTPAPFLPQQRITIFGREALLASLIAHLGGHLGSTGYMLSWILDIGLVMREWGPAMDPKLLDALLGDEQTRLLHSRVQALLGEELDLRIPPSLLRLSAGTAELDLEGIDRGRRRALWGLRRPRSWLRLAARGLGFVPDDPRPALRPGDILRWPADAWHERRARRDGVRGAAQFRGLQR